MSMFCFQCQEAAKNEGCTVRGMCGKKESTANLQDLLVHILKGIAVFGERAARAGLPVRDEALFVMRGLFATVTNTNFDDDRFEEWIDRGLKTRDSLRRRIENAGAAVPQGDLPDAAVWTAPSPKDFPIKAKEVGVLSTPSEDVRSLRELLVYGLKGMAAYLDHAAVLGYRDDGTEAFLFRGLASTTRDLSADEMTALVLECGGFGVRAMELLDRANTESYGSPEKTHVNIGVRANPGILISGHDLKDMEELLEQTAGTGVDVYTHGEMLPANAYPAFKKHDHFAGNYGGSWWRQNEEFASFHGPILMTTNCIVPVKESYRARLFTTGMAGYPGCPHVPGRPEGGKKDFSALIEAAKKCDPPEEIETGEIVIGFARNQVLSLADQIVEAVRTGAVKRFVVMAGCDGRQRTREYYTEVARELPGDAIVLTAGCAKYRYNKLDLGEIGGIPRVLDAGQCNDSYSLVFTALQLKEAFGLDDINDLPISYDIAWYEQKAVIVLLALLSLGVKNIRLGPTLPAFLSPGVAKVLVENFGIRGIGDPGEDAAAMMAGE
ncbi:MAG: hydroxylamine reductase [Candidatus Eisenbacteria bacterium]|nr:hydroxylamine reductase [Candidatus Eisenbacteria bacterium]